MYNHREYMKRYNKKYYPKHREKFIENANKWSKLNPEKIKESRKKNYEQYPERYRARAFINSRIKRNKLKRGNCVWCGINENIQFHHTDYKKREGVFLCINHHYRVHCGDLSIINGVMWNGI